LGINDADTEPFAIRADAVGRGANISLRFDNGWTFFIRAHPGG